MIFSFLSWDGSASRTGVLRTVGVLAGGRDNDRPRLDVFTGFSLLSVGIGLAFVCRGGAEGVGAL